jgi:hypothetical protein
MRTVKIALIFLFIISSTNALDMGAKWIPADVKTTWDRWAEGSCPEDSMCLVHPGGDRSLNGQPNTFYTSAKGLTGRPPLDLPMCINNTQSLLDYYCENGIWTTRTKYLAIQLFDMGIQSSQKFELTCGKFNEVLNEVNYLVSRITVNDLLTKNCPLQTLFPAKRFECINNICILKTPQEVVFGASLNEPVDGLKSFLKTLDAQETACNNVPVRNEYGACSVPPKGKLFYNPFMKSVIYTQTLTPTAPPANRENQLITQYMNGLKIYVSQFHDQTKPDRDYSAFNTTTLFKNIYYAQTTGKSIFSFLDQNQTNLITLDIAALQFTGFNLAKDPCLTLFMTPLPDDKSLVCQRQPAANTFLVASLGRETEPTQNLVKNWIDVTRKLRP